MRPGDEKFNPWIFELEALRLLGRVAASPLQILPRDLLERESGQETVDYVAGILAELWNDGLISCVVIRDIPGGDQMVAYAILAQAEDSPAICLQAYDVEPQYQAKFNKTNLLNMIIGVYPEIMTVCDREDVPFFEYLGFQFEGAQHFKEDPHYKLANYLTGGRAVMVRGDKSALDAPAFVLSDYQLKQIKEIANGE
jgi:hypothetical protein